MVLLIQLYGPMQAWSIDPRFDWRTTEPYPTKSGVVGLLASAMGRPRGSRIEDLAGLRMGVRADRPGQIEVDYQVVRSVRSANGRRLANAQTWRQYIADGAFLVGLEGEETTLREIQAALDRPRWIPYLGRKGFYPAAPLTVPNGIIGGSLETTLREHPPIVRPHATVAIAIFEDPESDISTFDQPQDFLPVGHRWGKRARYIRLERVPLGNGQT